MKNIFIIPTDKPSRLVKGETTGRLLLHNTYGTSTDRNETQNIYITNDEEIKERNWCIDTISKHIYKHPINSNTRLEYQKKIILTTDQELIKDGVQAIPDDFLEWFVKNPSCEGVEIDFKYENCIPTLDDNGNKVLIIKLPSQSENLGKITPKEEPKQETLEKAAFRFYPEDEQWADRHIFNLGAKWQQERSYSEEEVFELLENLVETFNPPTDNLKKWFKEFKKK